MCIVAIAWQLFDELPLVLLSNRDEFLERPTEPLHQWEDKPIFAGRDAQSGGTWLGIHQATMSKTQQAQSATYQRNGRWAAVLNFRDGVQASNDERSRGELVTDFLTNHLNPMEFARKIILQEYAGFNLIIGDSKQAVVVNNRGHAPTPLYAGLHVFSNGQPEESWFKTERLRGRLRQEILPLISENSDARYWQTAALEVLSDMTQAPTDKLPDTGVDIKVEQALSSIYIGGVNLLGVANANNAMPSYGTRTQSILTLRKNTGSGTGIQADIVSRECTH